MADEIDLLTRVKTDIGVNGTYHDDKLKGYIDEVKEYLLDAGVDKERLESNKSAGIIVRGVSDLWTSTGSDAKLSDYFEKRAIQLALKGKSKNV